MTERRPSPLDLMPKRATSGPCGDSRLQRVANDQAPVAARRAERRAQNEAAMAERQGKPSTRDRDAWISWAVAEADRLHTPPPSAERRASYVAVITHLAKHADESGDLIVPLSAITRACHLDSDKATRGVLHFLTAIEVVSKHAQRFTFRGERPTTRWHLIDDKDKD